jgi:hypothetical protein
MIADGSLARALDVKWPADLGRERRALRTCRFKSLNNFESLELRMAKMKRLLAASVAMGGPKWLGLGPGDECLLACPQGMRRIQGIFFMFGPPQQVKGDKAWDLIEVAVAIKPSSLKGLLLTPDNPEAIHCDEHSITPLREGDPSVSAPANFRPL